MIDATVVCKTFAERQEVEEKLKGIPGVAVHPCSLALAIEYEAPDTATDSEINHTTARLLDIIESVETHGVVIS